MARPKKYPDELVDRGVRLVFDSGRPIAAVARDLGVGSEILRTRDEILRSASVFFAKELDPDRTK